MKKEFKYTVERPEEISVKMQELDKEFREEFKAPTFKLNHKTFLAAAKCFENTSTGADKVEECTMKAFEPLGNYERNMQAAWKTELGILRPCLDKCTQANDKACYSACFNTFASSMHAKLAEIHKTIV